MNDALAKGVVSVVIPMYNTERTVLRALESVHAQDYEPLEIILVDDGSSDDTVRVVTAATGTPYDHLVELGTNQGVSAARNAGLALASGRYVAFLDADDAWRPEKTRLQVEMMESDPRITLVTCDALQHHLNNDPPVRTHIARPPVVGNDAWKSLLAYNFIPTPTVLVRRETVERVGGFRNDLPVGEDLDLWIRLALEGSVGCFQEVLVDIHSVPGSLMKTHRDREAEVVMAMIDEHLVATRGRLDASEIRRIRGQRQYQFAAWLAHEGETVRSWPFFLRAALLRHRPLGSLLAIAKSVVKGVVARRKVTSLAA